MVSAAMLTSLLWLLCLQPTVAEQPWTLKDNSGSHRKGGAESLDAIIAAFIPVFVTAFAYILIFVAIRDRYPWIYSPRTHSAVIPKRDRTPVQGLGRYDWVQTFRKIDDRFILQHQGLDAYLWFRFLKTSIFLCGVGTLLTWPVLIPVNATGGGTATQLDRISFSNIAGKNRTYAHAVVAWIFLTIVMYTVTRERIFLRELRQGYFLSRQVSESLSSRTVLFLHASQDAAEQLDDGLEAAFGTGARRHWIVTDVTELEKLVAGRNSDAMSLEDAQIALIRKVHKKLSQKGSSSSNAEQLAQRSRPQHHTIPVVGQKVDAITWHRDNLIDKAQRVKEARDAYKERPQSGRTAVFVEYASQRQARKAYHQLKLGSTLEMEPRFIALQPKEILWSNLSQAPAARLSKKAAASGLVAAIIIFWSIPVGIVGTISNIEYLTSKFHWLEFIDRLPGPILGLLTGLLPPFLLSWLVSYVPKLFRKMARRFEPTTSSAESLTQAWYFAFQLIQIFLVTTFSSGAAALIPQIAGDPKRIPDLLAENLPTASKFYITYFILQGLGSSAQNVLRYDDLGEYLFYDFVFDNTPRKKYENYVWMKGISWGTVYPKFANFMVIAIVYSTISPLVIGFAAVGIWLYYLSYRYNLLFTIQVKIDTKGDAYGLALQHMTTGVYLSELCLLGLFSAKKAPGPIVMMVIALVVTPVWHLGMNRLLRPVEKYMPRPLRQEDEEAPLIDGEDGAAEAAGHNGQDSVSTRLRKNAPGWLPAAVLDILDRFLLPSRDAQRDMKEWFQEADDTSDNETSPNEEQLTNAFTNPVLTSKTPKIWLVRDDAGVGKQELGANEKADIATSDEAAELDGRGNIVWDTRDGAANVPICKKPVRY